MTRGAPVSRRSWFRGALGAVAGLLGLSRLAGRAEPEEMVEVGWNWWSHSVIPTPQPGDFGPISPGWGKITPKWDYESARHFLTHFRPVELPVTGTLTFPDPITGEPRSVRVEPDGHGGHRVLLGNEAEASMVMVDVPVPTETFPLTDKPDPTYHDQ